MKKNLIFGLVAFTLFILLLEGGLRAYFWTAGRVQPSPLQVEQRLGWAPPAMTRTVLKSKGYTQPAVFTTVRDGFRRFGNPLTKKQKILVIGDSFTQATTASDGLAYFDVIAQQVDAEWFVFGCGGYGSLQEYMVLDRHIDEIRPDLILWQYGGNDLVNNDYEIESRSRVNNNHNTRPYWQDGKIRWRYPSQVGNFPSVLTRHSVLIRMIAVKWGLLLPAKGTVEERLLPGSAILERTETTTTQIMQMVRDRAGQIPVVAFLADDGWAIADDNFKRISESAGLSYIAGVPDVIREASRRGIPIDGRPYDSHWSVAGHRVAAEYLSGMLRRGGWIQPQTVRT